MECCERCGKRIGFMSRADSYFCSNACRQAAYREREALWRKFVPDNDERHDLKRFSLATDEQFEAALRLARHEGDLSRRNVLRHLEAVRSRNDG